MEHLKILKKANAKKAILLDLDNTLYDYPSCHKAALKKAHQYYCQAVDPISFKTFSSLYNQARFSVNKRLRNLGSSHSRLLYFQLLLERKFGRTDFKNSLRLENIYWKVFLRHMKAFTWCLPFLKWCRERKKKVIIVTNFTSEIQFRKLCRLRMGKYIDFIVTSEEAGIEKPHPKIFKLALKKVSCRPSQALVIGDNPTHDTCASLRLTACKLKTLLRPLSSA